jgi:hypothetical protein
MAALTFCAAAIDPGKTSEEASRKIAAKRGVRVFGNKMSYDACRASTPSMKELHKSSFPKARRYYRV